jgi:hypothetical protein
LLFYHLVLGGKVRAPSLKGNVAVAQPVNNVFFKLTSTFCIRGYIYAKILQSITDTEKREAANIAALIWWRVRCKFSAQRELGKQHRSPAAPRRVLWERHTNL